MRMIHVLRKPLSEGTVAANTLRHGCGGLNIDASRITSHGDRANESGGGAGAGQYDDGVRSRTEERTYGGTLGGRVADPHPGGRWPANVILQHLDGCRCDGVKRVKGHTGYPNGPGGKSMHYSDQTSRGSEVRPNGWSGHADEDGKETVANWICEAGCPVARLDEQSGVLCSPPTYTRSASGFNEGVYGEGMGQKAGVESLNYGDSGGASRFYKQVGSKTDE